jgi:hypothetical protein
MSCEELLRPSTGVRLGFSFNEVAAGKLRRTRVRGGEIRPQHQASMRSQQISSEELRWRVVMFC